MSVWGPGLYQNDVSEDVKSFYCDQLRRGNNSEQITSELLDLYKNEINDKDDSANFWLALADIQWDMGRLLLLVKNQALTCLKDGSGLISWEHSPKAQYNKRKKVLEKLLNKLNTPQPQEKKISQYRLYKCPWKIGDVFALPLDNNPNGNHSYLLLEKASERVFHPGHLIPVMYAKMLLSDCLPKNKKQYNELPYIIVSRHQVNIFQPHSQCSFTTVEFNSTVYDNSTINYHTEYRLSLITTSSKSLPSDLIYLGNFLDATHPKDEYIPPWDVNIPSFFWNEVVTKLLRCHANFAQEG